jgi:hypothetical protein
MEHRLKCSVLPSFAGKSRKRLRPTELTSNSMSVSSTPLNCPQSNGSSSDLEYLGSIWNPVEEDVLAPSTRNSTFVTARTLLNDMRNTQKELSRSVNDLRIPENEALELISRELPKLQELEKEILELSLPDTQPNLSGIQEESKPYAPITGPVETSRPRFTGFLVPADLARAGLSVTLLVSMPTGKTPPINGGMGISTNMTLSSTTSELSTSLIRNFLDSVTDTLAKSK